MRFSTLLILSLASLGLASPLEPLSARTSSASASPEIGKRCCPGQPKTPCYVCALFKRDMDLVAEADDLQRRIDAAEVELAKRGEDKKKPKPIKCCGGTTCIICPLFKREEDILFEAEEIRRGVEEMERFVARGG